MAGLQEPTQSTSMSKNIMTPGQEEDFVKWARIFADLMVLVKYHGWSQPKWELMKHARKKMEKGFELHGLTRMTDLSKVKLD